jgi:serine/threonine protein kinase
MLQCPPLDQWEALASGLVTDDELQRLVEHLDSCPSCEERMAHWQGSAPSLLPKKSRLASVPTADSDRVVNELCERLADAEVTAPAGDTDRHDDGTHAIAPKSIGPYELHGLLGRGGMGEVHKAWHKHLQRWVAIKLVAMHRRTDDDFRRRFAREMAVIGAVDSPYVVRALDAGVHDEQQYLVMELVQGRDLGLILKARRQLSIVDACEIARQAALGLAAIAARGLMHRDIKPSNLFLCEDGIVKLLDLGLARRIEIDDDESQLTSTLQVLGTPDYVSPEQVRQEAVDIRADVYSLGCTLYQMLAGRPPFAAPVCRTYAEKLMAHRDMSPPSLRALRSDIPPPLEKLVERMLAKQPADRLAAPSALATALAPFTTDAHLQALLQSDGAQPAATSADSASLPLPRRAPRSLRLVFAALATSIVLMLLGVVAYVVAGMPGNDHANTAQIPIPPGGSAKLVSPEDEGGKSGTSSVPAGEFPEELVWFDALRAKPKEYFWPHGVGGSHWEFDPKGKVVNLSAGDQGAIILGRADRPYYILRMTFNQNRWPGGIGLFFGLHEVPDAPVPTHRCQTIMFNKASSKPLNMILERATMTIRVTDKGRNLQSGPPIEVDSPLPRGTQQLLVEVRANRVTAVRLDGDLVDEFVADSFNRKVTDEDHQGQFGIWAHGADGTVSDAFLMLLPDEAR